MRNAGAHAGLVILRVMNEPQMAAQAYELDKKYGEQRVLVYDLGGSALRVSALAIDDGVFEVLATASDLHLGGADFDERVMDYLVKAYRSETGTDVASNLDALGKLKREVEKAKRILSTETSTRVDIQSFENGHNFSQTLTRGDFEELNMDLFLKTLESVEQVLSAVGLKKEHIDEVSLWT
jgi:heat shock protein 5